VQVGVAGFYGRESGGVEILAEFAASAQNAVRLTCCLGTTYSVAIYKDKSSILYFG